MHDSATARDEMKDFKYQRVDADRRRGGGGGRESVWVFWRCGSERVILLPSARHSSYIEKHQRPRNREGQEEKEKTAKMKENQSLAKPD